MSTDVLHEIHPGGPRFPVGGDHVRIRPRTGHKAVQTGQERAPIPRRAYVVQSAKHLGIGTRSRLVVGGWGEQRDERGGIVLGAQERPRQVVRPRVLECKR